ncbi:hypothetical protein ES319_D11G217000v1 [Gossypium barbadense]|uniref:Uncharacterized protein n=2 Tax=Gossypium TaxID=3633 RepID=A0A5J5PEW8_GOSBA|nr:hypothetical protein ES319_D11G217000v1 [Gossypium barbadense]
MMVADFIVKKSRLWNEELIRSTFSMTDAKHILSIPLARIPQDDFLVWKGEASGEYFVRSAYKMPLQLLGDPTYLQQQTKYMPFYKKL